MSYKEFEQKQKRIQNIIVLSDFQMQWLQKHITKADSIKNIGVDFESGTLYVESIWQGCLSTVRVGISDIILETSK
jgi:hypothetical protein